MLARTLAAELPEDIDPRVFVHAVLAANPSAFGFALDLSRGTGAHLFFGASPELLVRRSGLRIRSVPLAGSLPRSADPRVDAERARALAASSKDLLEHAFVVDAITERLRPLCRELSVPARPTVLATPRMWHLATDIEGVLRDSSVSAADLALALHPTPAVGGAPTAEALATIGELEPRARGLYAGAVGWTDSTGDGEWAVAIRSAEVVGRTLRLFAGAGVVAESTPEGEIAETAAKFRTLLDAIGGGTPGGEAAPRRAQMSTSKSSTPSKPSPAARSAAK